jgi:hypothetical protein
MKGNYFYFIFTFHSRAEMLDALNDYTSAGYINGPAVLSQDDVEVVSHNVIVNADHSEDHLVMFRRPQK